MCFELCLSALKLPRVDRIVSRQAQIDAGVPLQSFRGVLYATAYSAHTEYGCRHACRAPRFDYLKRHMESNMLISQTFFVGAVFFRKWES